MVSYINKWEWGYGKPQIRFRILRYIITFQFNSERFEIIKRLESIQNFQELSMNYSYFQKFSQTLSLTMAYSYLNCIV